MGQQGCCKVASSNTYEITHELNQQNHNTQHQDINSPSSPPSPASLATKQHEQQQKKRRIQNFYGASDSAVTKTMTKQINMPELQTKISKLDSVVEECSNEENQKSTDMEIDKENKLTMNTKQFIKYQAQKLYHNIEKNMLENRPS